MTAFSTLRAIPALASLVGALLAHSAVHGQEFPSYQSTFRVKYERTMTRGDHKPMRTASEVDVHLFSIQTAKGRRVIAHLDAPAGTLPLDVALGGALLRGSKLSVEVESPTGRYLSKVLPTLTSELIPRDRTEASSEGTEKVVLKQSGIRKPAPLSYRSDTHPDDAACVLYARSLTSPVEVKVGTTPVVLSEYKHEAKLNGDDFRILEVNELLVSTRGTDATALETRIKIEAKETAFAQIEDGTARAILQQFDALTPMVRASFPGGMGARGKDANKQLDKLEKLIAKHPQSPLRASFPWLKDRLLAGSMQGATPLATFDGLPGKKAPGFALEGTDGKHYDLDELRGKAVLLFFYTYT